MRILEFLYDENCKFSNNRLITTLFGLSATIISFYLVFTNTLNSDYNILIGILTSSAIGNKFIGTVTKRESTTNVDSQK